ncbi:hypothetical protein IFT48_03920 [Pseudomonas fluorescens]|uniref:hypothetical protein n=1 Tax=Pseudomonas fluorescens TaxID=294 RepID=UPI001930B51C|nr:hypothetical protein [Pseudomonas fluorescens]MBD8089118.1 hypothetical protein [Pseudomonas fluorescens]
MSQGKKPEDDALDTIQVLNQVLSLGDQIDQCIGHIRRGSNVNQEEIWSASERVDNLCSIVRKALSRKPAQVMVAEQARPLDPQARDTQVAVQTLRSMDEIKVNLHVAREAGLEISVTPELEAIYVAEYGNEGKRNLDVMLGRADTIGSVNVRTFMALDDPAA